MLTFLEQRESVLQQVLLMSILEHTLHRLANKTVCKLLKQVSNSHFANQFPKSFFELAALSILKLLNLPGRRRRRGGVLST